MSKSTGDYIYHDIQPRKTVTTYQKNDYFKQLKTLKNIDYKYLQFTLYSLTSWLSLPSKLITFKALISFKTSITLKILKVLKTL